MAVVEGIMKQLKAKKPNYDLVDTAATDLPFKMYL